MADPEPQDSPALLVETADHAAVADPRANAPADLAQNGARRAGGHGGADGARGLGVAVKYPTVTTIRVALIKGWNITWPRIETEDLISARPLEDAMRIAYRDLACWMVDDYGFDEWDAYMVLSQCGITRVGNFVDPKYTVGAAIRKSYLAG